MVLGMEVGLSPGDFVLDGDPAPSQKTGRTPKFSAYVCVISLERCTVVIGLWFVQVQVLVLYAFFLRKKV